MKTYKYIKWGLFTVCALALSACVDENMNINPNTSSNIDPNMQLTTVQVKPGNYSDEWWAYFVFPGGFMNHWSRDWSVVNYGGSGIKSDSHSSRLWSESYKRVIKEVVDLVKRTDNSEEYANVNAAARILKVENFLKLTDYYGDIPYFEAGKAKEGILKPAYDTQKTIYMDFLKELKEAAAQFDDSKSPLTGDLYFKGDLSKWRKFANSLRFRIAMRLINVTDTDVDVKSIIENAASAQYGLMTANSDICYLQYDNVSSTEESAGNGIANLLSQATPSSFALTKELIGTMELSKDPRIRFYGGSYLTDGVRSSRTDITNDLYNYYKTTYPAHASVYRHFTIPAQRFPWDGWEWNSGEDKYDDVTIVKNGQTITLGRDDQWFGPSNYINQPGSPMIHMAYAEVEFLLADALLRGYNVSTDPASEHFKKGLMAAVNQWILFGATINPVMLQEFLDANPLSSDVNTALAQVNLQIWILHFLDPFEAWANWRRTGLPVEQMAFKNANPGNESNGQTPRRMEYPVSEQTMNPDGYKTALSRMGGVDDWLNRVWWDQRR